MHFGQQTGGAILGYANNATTTDRPMTPMESALASTANGIEELSSCIETLASRMALVLCPDPNRAADGVKQAGGLAAVEPMHCHAVTDLHSQRQRLELLMNRVNDLRNRLEV